MSSSRFSSGGESTEVASEHSARNERDRRGDPSRSNHRQAGQYRRAARSAPPRCASSWRHARQRDGRGAPGRPGGDADALCGRQASRLALHAEGRASTPRSDGKTAEANARGDKRVHKCAHVSAMMLCVADERRVLKLGANGSNSSVSLSFCQSQGRAAWRSYGRWPRPRLGRV